MKNTGSPNDKKPELTGLGFSGLIPFAIGGIGVWLLPIFFTMRSGDTLADITLLYGAIIASYLAGFGAGGLVANTRGSDESLLPGMIAALVAWLALWPEIGSFSLWRPMIAIILILVLVYLMLRDLRAVKAGNLPIWYGQLRQRLTFWACVSLSSIAVHQTLGILII